MVAGRSARPAGLAKWHLCRNSLHGTKDGQLVALSGMMLEQVMHLPGVLAAETHSAMPVQSLALNLSCSLELLLIVRY